VNVGALKSGKFEAVEADIRRVVEVSHRGNAACKAIIETALLNHDEKIRASQIAVQAGADYVKTSTGFSTGGATEEDVRLIRSAIGPNAGLKASGGIRTLEELRKMVAAGATRIGASAGVKIIQESRTAEKTSRPNPRRAPDPY
jgi:deoxyribose-phosphate aldolase